MKTLRLSSGVCVSSDNPDIIQQYLSLGAVEVGCLNDSSVNPVDVKATETEIKNTIIEEPKTPARKTKVIKKK